MSDPVTCERCGRPGRRLLGHIAPDGWYFGSFTFDSEGDHDPGDLLIVHACSPECRDALWTKMDGHRWSAIEQRVDITAEVRRYIRLRSARLREDAKRILTGTTYPDGTDANVTAAQLVARLLNTHAGELETAAETEIEWLGRRGGNAGEGGA